MYRKSSEQKNLLIHPFTIRSSVLTWGSHQLVFPYFDPHEQRNKTLKASAYKMFTKAYLFFIKLSITQVLQ
ncbi:hypothetical protein EFB08_02510 [Rufibacter latericius]|uniref:Uncharacterized protein n=1 Tax=Rufibacter latericius TaxID=2487040 RepID=A0A3M9N0U1_9BACT|nr:hypothetical protein EFB08_02510 [Rufibacter latericius]